MPSNLIRIAVLTQSIENGRDGESNPKILQHSVAFFLRLEHSTKAPLWKQRKMLHLNIAFDRYACMGTVMRYILVISFPLALMYEI